MDRMTHFAKFIFCLLFLAPATAFAQPANDHLLSAQNLSQLAPHVWMIKGFPNIGIVVGSKATLVIDTGLGTKNGAIVAGVARRLSPKGHDTLSDHHALSCRTCHR